MGHRLRISITTNGPDVERALGEIGMQQLPFALSRSLTDLAKAGKADLQDEMRAVFDRPTSFVVNGVAHSPASKRDLQSRVFLREFAGKGGTTAGTILGPHIDGGPRSMKRFEKALAARGILPPGKFAVPAAGARLNRNGNLTSGTLTRILSQLGAYRETGYVANQTARSAQRRRTSRSATYFVMRRAGQPIGIGERRGRRVRLVLAFVSQPVYSKRLAFYDVVEDSVRRNFGVHFNRRYREAMMTARPVRRAA